MQIIAYLKNFLYLCTQIRDSVVTITYKLGIICPPSG